MSTQHGILPTGTVQTPGPTLEQMKQTLFRNITYRLGGGIIDLEVDNEHFESAYSYSIALYRQKSQNATKEGYIQMTVVEDLDTYTLPQEFANVRNIFRRTIGLETGPASSSFDPFSSAILNTYLLNYNHAGGMATYDFYQGYIKLAARMFGGYVIFTFDPATKILRIVRDPRSTGERVLIWADIWRSEEDLLKDPGSGVWLGDYILATLKVIIGEAREKFSTIPGPGGGTSLNGTAMKAEGKELQQALIDDLHKYGDHSQPLSFIIG